jgi:hypothetical protein
MHSTSPRLPAVRIKPEATIVNELRASWPLAVIVLGLVLSAIWCVGLLWGAYLVLDWTEVFPAAITLLDATPAR